MSDSLRFRDGCVAIGLPIQPAALAAIRRQVPRGSRSYDPARRELLVAENYGLAAIDILSASDAGTIGGAR